MKPEADDILSKSAGQMMTHLAPLLPASYWQGSAAVVALLMKFAAREYERGADIRARENAGMRALFSELAVGVRDASLKARLAQAATSRDESLAISALDSSNASLRGLLIALQIDAEEGTRLEDQRRIWNFLRTMADGRAVSVF